VASDPALVRRLREVLHANAGVEERRMFGGVCFTLHGKMCVGVHNANLILRVGEERATELMRQPGVRPMDLTGKVMKAWATVLPAAIGTDAALARFARLAVEFVSTLPRK